MLPYSPRRVCDATRTISSRTRCISSALMPGRICSSVTASRPAARRFQRRRHPVPPGDPRRQKLRILVDESRQILLHRQLAALRREPPAARLRVRTIPSCTALNARSIFATPSRCSSARTAELRSASSATLRLRLFSSTSSFSRRSSCSRRFRSSSQFRLVCRFALGLFVAGVLLDRLPHDRLNVDSFHKPPLNSQTSRCPTARPSALRRRSPPPPGSSPPAARRIGT